MPRENAATGPQGDTKGAQDTGENNAVTSTVPEATAADLLHAANVPDEVVKALGAVTEETETAEAPPAEETDEQSEQPKEQSEESEGQGQDEELSEAESSKEESSKEQREEELGSEEEDSGGDESEREPVEGKGPSWYQKRLSKWTRQKDRLQDEIDELKDRLARQAEPKTREETPAQQGQNAFSNIDNLEDLGRVVQAQREVRDWCLGNPDGMVLNEGKPNEQVVSPEEVRKTLIGATRILEDSGRVANEIQARQQWRGIAEQEWPELFDKKSEVHHTAQEFLKQYPAIGSIPTRDFVLGLMVEGWKTFQPRLAAKQQAQQQPQVQVQANGANGEKKESLPEALKRKIPPIPKTQAPNPPRGNRIRSPQTDAAAAVQRLIQSGGSPEAAHAAIAAIERQNAAAGATKRTAAPV